MKHKLLIGTFVALGAVVAGIILGTPGQAQDQHNGDPIAPMRQLSKVVVDSVKPNPQISPRRYPGTVQASRQTELAFRVAGPLVAVDVAPGMVVEKGQRLMQIDPRDFEDRIRVLEAQLVGAVASRQHSRQDYDRAITLFEQQVNAKADYDRAKSAYDSAVAMEQSLNAQLQIARHQLQDTTLQAPYTGVITEQRVENYEMLQVGQVVLSMQDSQNLEVLIQVPENEIAHSPLHQGQTAQVEFTAVAGQRFSATLKEWKAAADRVTRSYALTFAFTAPENIQILPGMTADVFWQCANQGSEQAVEKKVSIPAGAVFSQQGHESYVWVYQPETRQVLRRAVELYGLQGQGGVTLSGGLDNDDWIVVSGAENLVEGMDVDAVTAAGQRM